MRPRLARLSPMPPLRRKRGQTMQGALRRSPERQGRRQLLRLFSNRRWRAHRPGQPQPAPLGGRGIVFQEMTSANGAARGRLGRGALAVAALAMAGCQYMPHAYEPQSAQIPEARTIPVQGAFLTFTSVGSGQPVVF